MAEPTVSVQFWPWHSLGDMRAHGRKAIESYPFDFIWSADEFLYEDSITLLGVLAMELDTSVGTLVTFPWRNPIELAQRFASMAKLSRPGRGVALGIWRGRRRPDEGHPREDQPDRGRPREPDHAARAARR